MPEITTNIVPCVNGHFYDANKNSRCPFCTTPATPVNGGFSQTVDVNGSASSNSGFSKTTNVAPVGPWKVQDVGPTRPVNNGSNMGVTQTAGDDDTPAGAPSPVVGWLVALNGPNRGTDYRIHAGYNYIGREKGDICIKGDMLISGQMDSNIAFVPQSNRFFIAHEQGKNMALVNDEIPITGSSVELHNLDRITIGGTTLLFVALCGEQFSWVGKKENQHV